MVDISEDPSDGAQSSGDSGPSTSTAHHPNTGMAAVVEHIMRDKVEFGMWLSRTVTLIFTISFVLPIFGVSQVVSGQRVLIGGAITSALRLHQRVPRFQMNRQFLASIFVEDSAHYLLYSVIMLFTTQPVSLILMPVFLFAVLHVTKYTKALINLMGPSSLGFVRNLIMKVDTNQQVLLRLIACMEIFLMPSSIMLVFSGQAALLLPFLYYRFLCLRYSSLRNPYSRQLFAELRLSAEHLAQHARCPAIVGSLIHKIIGFIVRLAPVTAAAQ